MISDEKYSSHKFNRPSLSSLITRLVAPLVVIFGGNFMIFLDW